MTLTINMILFEDKGKYSMFDTSCQRFWIHITKFFISHIHKNKNHEWWAHCKLTKQDAVPSNKAAIDCITEGWRTISIFERNNVECFVSACRLKELCHLPLRICMAQRTKCFLWNICYLTFFVVTDFMDDFLYPYGLMYFVDLVALLWSFLAAGNDWSCERDKT
jgi:hypothetical protein